MSVSVEKLENSMARLTVEVDASEVDKAIDNVYRGTKNRIQVPGFRKGKAPRSVIERMYGKNIFYEDAADRLVNDNYPDAAENCGEEVVSMPRIQIVQIESGKPFIFTAEVALRPEVNLGKYKGIEVEEDDPEITDEDVERELDRVRNLNARYVPVEDREAQSGDTVDLDYEGFIDGKAFDGGKDEGHSLELGSGSFIPGFEDQLIGKKINEPCEVKVTFPEQYHEASLAGKEAVFKCVINSIRAKELPELSDEYVSEISEYDTVDAYRASIKKRLIEEEEKNSREVTQNICVMAVIDDSKVDIPDLMLKTQERDMVMSFLGDIRRQGMDPSAYLKMMGSTREQLMDQFEAQAKNQIIGRLVLEEIAEKENLEPTDEEVEKKLEEYSKNNFIGIDDVKKMFAEEAQNKRLRKDIAVEKAADFLVDNAKRVPKKTEEDKDKDK